MPGFITKTLKQLGDVLFRTIGNLGEAKNKVPTFVQKIAVPTGDVYAIATDGTLRHLGLKRSGTSQDFGSWQNVDDSVALKEIAVSGNGVFGIGSDDALWFISQTGSSLENSLVWGSWQRVDDSVKLKQIVVLIGGGEGFGIGTDNILWHRGRQIFNPGGGSTIWLGWEVIGYSFKQISLPNDTGDLFGLRTDDHLWHVVQGHTGLPGGDWKDLGGNFAQIAVVPKVGRAVFAIGTDRGLWYLEDIESSPPKWQSLTGAIKRITVANGGGEVLAIGADDALWHILKDVRISTGPASWAFGSWKPLDDSIKLKEIAVVEWGTELYGIDTNGVVCYKTKDPLGKWSTWRSLP